MRVQCLKLKKLVNTRDLGGISAEGGKRIKHNMLIRSGKLYKLPESTFDALIEMGLKVIIDMRIDTEVNEYPYTVPEGIKYIRLPMLCTATAGITHDKNMFRTMLNESRRIKEEFENADNYMVSMYKLILYAQQSKEQIRKFFNILLEEDGCILWHCSAGKDRAGIAAMLLEGVLGVNEEDIIRDYTSSQHIQSNKRFWQKAGLYIFPAPPRLRGILVAMMNAKSLYITAAINEIKKVNGSIVQYCKSELALTDENIQTLKNKYLE